MNKCSIDICCIIMLNSSDCCYLIVIFMVQIRLEFQIPIRDDDQGNYSVDALGQFQQANR